MRHGRRSGWEGRTERQVFQGSLDIGRELVGTITR